MNREQRRAQLKDLSKKFTGFNITSGVVDIPVGTDGTKLQFDTMNYDTIYYLSELVDKFSHIEETYADDFKKVEEADESRRQFATVKLYKKIITDFCEVVEHIFGEGSVVILFGNTAPMPQVIAEFLEDLAPIVAVLPRFAETDTKTSPVALPGGYSSEREGNV